MLSMVLRICERLFPVHRHEWPKALMLLGVAVLLGIGSTSSRAASEALFLTRFGVGYLPYVQLINPLLVLVATTLYGIFAGRISNDRMMIYTGLLPIPLILLMRFLMVLNIGYSGMWLQGHTVTLSWTSGFTLTRLGSFTPVY